MFLPCLCCVSLSTQACLDEWIDGLMDSWIVASMDGWIHRMMCLHVFWDYSGPTMQTHQSGESYTTCCQYYQMSICWGGCPLFKHNVLAKNRLAWEKQVHCFLRKQQESFLCLPTSCLRNCLFSQTYSNLLCRCLIRVPMMNYLHRRTTINLVVWSK